MQCPFTQWCRATYGQDLLAIMIVFAIKKQIPHSETLDYVQSEKVQENEAAVSDTEHFMQRSEKNLLNIPSKPANNPMLLTPFH
jgi:hypothetical protein